MLQLDLDNNIATIYDIVDEGYTRLSNFSFGEYIGQDGNVHVRADIFEIARVLQLLMEFIVLCIGYH